jgi:NitT/TauT family transport system permease protein
MEWIRSPSRWLPVAVVAVLLGLAALLYGPQQIARIAERVVPPAPELGDIPGAAAWSLLRMTGSYLASFGFAWLFGAWAASSPRVARIVLPLLDVGQSVPVLGFFPAAIYLFITLLGGGRVSLELAAMFLIFTSQVWNLAFAVYEGLTTIPPETRAATQSLNVRGVLLWRTLYIPACIPSLVYNSILSWANGWYFLIACEIIVAGPVQYDLPGLGSMLARSLAEGQLHVAVAALLTLIGIVLAMEVVIWRPLRAWSRRFRYDTSGTDEEDESARFLPEFGLPLLIRPVRAAVRALWRRLPLEPANVALDRVGAGIARTWRILRWPVWAALFAALVFATMSVFDALAPPWPARAAELPWKLLLSFLRINAAYVLALLWVIPAALWASDHPRGLRWLSMFAQVGASIPATAFFPLLVAMLVGRFGGMELVSIALALTGMQWYLLFNVLAGVQRVPGDLKESLRALGLTRREIHRKLVLPACMPSLVTGSVVAWGGTWNALILSEYVVYRDKVYQVSGIGSELNRAVYQSGERTMLFLSLALIVVTVVSFNRIVWARLYRHVQEHYQLEG